MNTFTRATDGAILSDKVYSEEEVEKIFAAAKIEGEPGNRVLVSTSAEDHDALMLSHIARCVFHYAT
jgi:hypothetical protein